MDLYPGSHLDLERHAERIPSTVDVSREDLTSDNSHLNGTDRSVCCRGRTRARPSRGFVFLFGRCTCSPISSDDGHHFCVRSSVYRTIGVLEGPGERRYEPSLPWSGTKTRRCNCASVISNKCIADTPRNETCKATFECCVGRGPADRHMRNGGGPKGRWRKAWIGTDDVLSILCHAAMDGP